MRKFKKQAKIVKDYQWQVTRWTKLQELHPSKKNARRIKYYLEQYKVAFERIKTM